MQRRPAFPARLATGHPDTTKNIAQQLYPTSGSGQKTSQKSVVPAAEPFSGDLLAARERMVRQVQALGVPAPALLAAIGQVARHRFVDTALVGQAYEDTSLPIGLGQTISKPSVVARMAELLCAAPITRGGTVRLGRILEIGTGCGYQAAVLARLAVEVYSIERLRGLHESARDKLRPFRLANVHLLFGDGMQGFAKGAPYAGIIAAAGGEALPPAWIEQLAVGDRLVAPLVTDGGRQALIVIDKTINGCNRRVLEGVHFVPLKSGIA
ncbi:MAG: protein-L-isoaspartate(D-aspartate) O-methyltransferase [Burkholderiales bacterium]